MKEHTAMTTTTTTTTALKKITYIAARLEEKVDV
jgi:hypothetical protein